MAKNIYVGSSNKARLVKKAYIGVSSKACNIIKGYVGVGGKARTFFTLGPRVERFKSFTGTAKYAGIAGVSFSNFAVFYNRGFLDYYDSSLTLTSDTRSTDVHDTEGACNSNYVMFSGGWDYNTSTTTYINATFAINSSKTISSPSTLSYKPGFHSAGNIGNYIVFAGGKSTYSISCTYFDTVNAYNLSLTRSIPTSLSCARAGMSVAKVGSYLIFYGGTDYYYTGTYRRLQNIDLYNSSLTRSTDTMTLDGYRMCFGCGCSVGDYAIFCGGGSSSTPVVNSSLSWSYAPTFPYTASNIASCSFSDFAVFAGGMSTIGPKYDQYTEYYSNVTCYNSSLTMTTSTPLGGTTYSAGGASINDYGIFAGGGSTSGAYAYYYSG